MNLSHFHDSYVIITMVIYMKQVIVIGGGPSGLTTAICAAKRGYRVTILERNKSCLKKLLITGNGHCNYWNEDQNNVHYHTTDNDEVDKLLPDSLKKEALKFIESLGIVPKIKNGYYYPFSNQATSMKEALLTEAHRLGVSIKTEQTVVKLEKHKDLFLITTDKNQFQSSYVVLATGSKAYPKTGSDGLGYQLATKLGHTITKVHPSLVQLEGNEKYAKDWNGVRADVTVSLYKNKNKIKEECGEIQLTEYGLSGICIFNLSREIASNQNKNLYDVLINFTPWVTTSEELDIWFKNREKILKKRTIEQMLEGFLNYKIIHVITKKMHIAPDYDWCNMSKAKKWELYKWLISYPVHVSGTKSFEHAQVCSGGLNLKEVHIDTLESKKVKGLYFVGEVLDVDGDCGGYNLGFAWMSGLKVGKHIGEEYD